MNDDGVEATRDHLAHAQLAQCLGLVVGEVMAGRCALTGFIQRLIGGVLVKGVDGGKVHHAAHADFQRRLRHGCCAVDVDGRHQPAQVTVDRDLGGEVKELLRAIKKAAQAVPVDELDVWQVR